MKPLLLNATDIRGGAARAAHRLFDGLRRTGMDARMLVQEKGGDSEAVMAPRPMLGDWWPRLRPHLDALPLRLYPKADVSKPFSNSYLPGHTLGRIQAQAPDLIHLHWVCEGFFPPRMLAQLEIPVVWTLHDLWPVTGGCHYPGSCEGFIHRCGHCPILGSASSYDLSRWNWWRKERAWRRTQLTAVAPSNWIAEKARASSLFSSVSIEVIPNGIDTELFKPREQRYCRELLGLPPERPLLLFGSCGGLGDRRKGFDLLVQAVADLRRDASCPDFEVVTVGGGEVLTRILPGITIHSMGRIHDDLGLALLYAAADLLVAPSREENLSNMVMEAMACGIPTVAFAVGGMPDLIKHLETGYLAASESVAELARGIKYCLSDSQRLMHLGQSARHKVLLSYSLDIVANQHIRLYEDVLKAGKRQLSL
ncbi:MAG: hypothetical protein A2091_02830 [Desulfuromonadales bacterium GWD2_61_12]|nr:MAG: hypothetical protein A2091_02830 [Desulfuromonadales bacterium GWD2_61_12]